MARSSRLRPPPGARLPYNGGRVTRYIRTAVTGGAPEPYVLLDPAGLVLTDPQGVTLDEAA